METRRICPSCQKPIAPDGPLGLCPECLVKSGLDTGPVGQTAFTPPPVAEIARLFPQFEILGLIGRGGMGAVYKARQPKLDRLMALKVLPASAASDPGFTERFDREAKALARLNHPNIVAVYDFGTAGELSFLVMEFVDGPNLREVGRTNRLTPQQALQVVPQICDALQFAHNEGIVHRDIKPENILLDAKGRVKIADFGIAKIVGAQPDHLTLTGGKDVIGTPHYMAPEQLERPQSVDHRADIFSLGVVFYELLTGELPLGRFAPPSRKVQVDVRLDEVVLRTLEKEPERRYQQASQVKTAVDHITATPRPLSPPPLQKSKPEAWSGKQLALAAVVIITLFVVIGVTALLWKQSAPTGNVPVNPQAETKLPATDTTNQLPRSLTAREQEALAKVNKAQEDGILADLRSRNSFRRNLAILRLSHFPTIKSDRETFQILTNALTDPNFVNQANAVRALGAWGDGEAVPPLLNMLATPEFPVRWAAIEALAGFKDIRAAQPLAVLLSDQSCSQRAETALIALGPTAEAATLTALAKQTGHSQLGTFRVLKAIGTQKSVPALAEAAHDADGLVAMLARDALNTIELREQIQTSIKSQP